MPVTVCPRGDTQGSTTKQPVNLESRDGLLDSLSRIRDTVWVQLPPRARFCSAVAAAVLLVGCGSGETTNSPPRDVALEANEFSFQASEAITITSGDTINFNVRNVGDLDHQMEVWNSENRVLGKTDRIPPGATRSVTVTFDEAGSYRVVCDIDNHLTLGQQANFNVVDSSG